ncbi:MAG TPA: cytochrome c1 [Candidatus Polarisedimenticolia bacterium]|jgi:ubiquinol-cytochrome c reductase cytochrome c1 subunit|nr:cytochrome c1 [Dongiaceae bacterium]HYV87203.1 cytochrome c1 [Candidatus Polarisedimenticolia bacterium]
MRRLALAAAAVALIGSTLAFSPARAQETPALPEVHWSFSGIFGVFDHAQARRGFQVYKEVCSACHSMNLLAYRNLEALGFTEDEVKAIAASVQVPDLDDNGEVKDRPGKPSDHFQPPFANALAARAANNGALPPDLSVIVKARKGGADYPHALMIGFVEPPAGFKLQNGMNYNEYFPGHQIAMPPPLQDNSVKYADGTQATLDQESQDVAAFLAWAAEPELEQRHETGVKVILFLIVLTALVYAYKRKVWAKVH